MTVPHWPQHTAYPSHNISHNQRRSEPRAYREERGTLRSPQGLGAERGTAQVLGRTAAPCSGADWARGMVQGRPQRRPGPGWESREANVVGMGLSDEGGKYGHGFKCANQEPQLVRRCPAPASCPAPPIHYPALLLLASPPPRCLTCKHTLPNSLLYLLGHKPTTPFHAPPFVSVCPSPAPEPRPTPHLHRVC